MCARCGSSEISRRGRRTALGYRTFGCEPAGASSTSAQACRSTISSIRPDVVLLAVMWRLRYRLSFRDVAELLLKRGFEVTHETVARLGVSVLAAACAPVRCH